MLEFQKVVKVKEQVVSGFTNNVLHHPRGVGATIGLMDTILQFVQDKLSVKLIETSKQVEYTFRSRATGPTE